MTHKTYHGSCQCGAVRFRADIDLAGGTTKCNCTTCFKARAWKTFIKPEAFHLTDGADVLATYGDDPRGVRYFCTRCGLRTHEKGEADYMGGAFVGIYVSILDDVTPEELIAAPLRVCDGLNNNWQATPAEIRHL